jgi:hypothetical protein
MFQAAKGFGMKNPVPVTLELRAEGALLHGIFSLSFPALGRKGRKDLILLFFNSFSHVHHHATSMFTSYL